MYRNVLLFQKCFENNFSYRTILRNYAAVAQLEFAKRPTSIGPIDLCNTSNLAIIRKIGIIFFFYVYFLTINMKNSVIKRSCSTGLHTSVNRSLLLLLPKIGKYHLCIEDVKRSTRPPYPEKSCC